MRLGDLDALLDKQESLYMKGHVLFHGVTAYAIENAPTIDPESLPIVQQLRAELERVKAERDAVVRDMHQNAKCFICMHLPDDGNMAHCKHYAACGLTYIHWKWRGEKENNNANQKD